MHYALLQAAPHAHVVRAFDINEVANDVYEHNFGQRPWEGNIESVRLNSRVQGIRIRLYLYFLQKLICLLRPRRSKGGNRLAVLQEQSIYLEIFVSAIGRNDPFKAGHRVFYTLEGCECIRCRGQPLIWYSLQRLACLHSYCWTSMTYVPARAAAVQCVVAFSSAEGPVQSERHVQSNQSLLIIDNSSPYQEYYTKYLWEFIMSQSRREHQLVYDVSACK